MSDRETLNCEEAIRLLAAYLDGELESESAVQLEDHLDRCRSCYSRHEFEKGLKERVADLSEERLRSEFEERIQGLVSRFAGSRSRSRSGEPGADADDGGP